MAVDASYAATRMRACLPIGLNTALMTAKTRLILDFGRLTGVLAERDQATDALAPSCSNMVAPRAMAILASLFFDFVARVEKKNFSHLSLGKFFKLGGVASAADFVANVGSRGGFGRVACGGPDP